MISLARAQTDRTVVCDVGDDATIENHGKTMVNAFGMLGVIVLVGSIVALLDWLGRRKDRQSKRRPAA